MYLVEKQERRQISLTNVNVGPSYRCKGTCTLTRSVSVRRSIDISTALSLNCSDHCWWILWHLSGSQHCERTWWPWVVLWRWTVSWNCLRQHTPQSNQSKERISLISTLFVCLHFFGDFFPLVLKDIKMILNEEQRINYPGPIWLSVRNYRYWGISLHFTELWNI